MSVIEAGTVTTVNVTRSHIGRGEPCKTGRCPIALAIIDTGAVPEGMEVSVTRLDVTLISYEGEALRAPLPQEASDFIAEYDECGDAEALGFEITWRQA